MLSDELPKNDSEMLKSIFILLRGMVCLLTLCLSLLAIIAFRSPRPPVTLGEVIDAHDTSRAELVFRRTPVVYIRK